MKFNFQIAATISFPIYLAVVLFTDFSFTGYWTDVVFSLGFSVLAYHWSFENELKQRWLNWTLRLSNIFATLIVYVLMFLQLINPFAWNVFQMRSFYFQQVDGRLFNAYFKPVGAYAGGYGIFWISETPKY